MSDPADLGKRVTEAKQALLMALRLANEAALDGSRDAADLASLTSALEQTKRAKDAIEQLQKRFAFQLELAKVRSGELSGEHSRGTIGLVRLGVDGGYPIEEVRRMIDEAAGHSPPPATA